MTEQLNDLKLHEECGVFGIYTSSRSDAPHLTYSALFALQHRGQESAGIAVNDNGIITCYKDMGLVTEVFNKHILDGLKGSSAIGHVRYSTSGLSARENAHPLLAQYKGGHIAIAHNGNIVNAKELKLKMEEEGAIFQTSSDTEVILHLISKYRLANDNFEDAITQVMKDIRGSYSLVLLTPHKLIGARDPFGLRPLCLGRIDDSYVLASETCALDAIGAKHVRDVKPGEIVVIDDKGIESIQVSSDSSQKTGLCIFEFIYFARPDSIIDGTSVYESRLQAGRLLGVEHPADADLVIAAPDSGIIASLGYAEQTGLPYAQGLVRNRYIGRTFIQPSQELREMGVQMKFNPIRGVVEGKRIVLVDDSLVRGTTTRLIVQMLRDAGAKEVHMRISSPPMKYPCHLGVNIPTSDELVASDKTTEEVKNVIKTDSLKYLSIESLLKNSIKM